MSQQPLKKINSRGCTRGFEFSAYILNKEGFKNRNMTNLGFWLKVGEGGVKMGSKGMICQSIPFPQRLRECWWYQTFPQRLWECWLYQTFPQRLWECWWYQSFLQRLWECRIASKYNNKRCLTFIL